MCGKGSFFTQSALDLEATLFGLKDGHCNGNTNILLFAMNGARAVPNGEAVCGAPIHKICKDVFGATKSIYDTSDVTVGSCGYACAWYSRDNHDIGLAAERIRERLMQLADIDPAFYSISVSEMDAFFRITSLEENQIGVDPLVGVSNDYDQSFLNQAARLIAKHLPCSRAREPQFIDG